MPDTRPRRRVSVRLTEDEYQRVLYWAQRRGLSIDGYLYDALETRIAIENHDYDLDTAEVQRVNQLTEAVQALTKSQESLERVVTSGFDTLIGLTNGDNYLADLDERGVK